MKYRLGNICKIGDGLHGTPNYCKNNEFYFINGNNLKGELIDLSNARSVSKAEYLKYNPNLIPQKTVLLSINGTLGNTAIYNGESIILSKSVAFFECSTDIITPEYLKLYFESCNFQNILNNMATGTTIKNVGLKSLRSLMIDLPSINIQREIVNIIKPFENKLYLNNQINDNLAV
ncbi:restriction endonuclease subunit S [Limosilactobacillus reuteri]|uniref:restriction endonuclease subunit S n=1 Tax=Limosilactobacillus reuteri TaxID=1598 RepID=UPI001F57CF26|nr:restriction endonuclease subunit S [Limosilactobacillus reuteri]UNL39925.1 restriction endonuclease subunit S [Limosilactobacillus reuteri]